MEKDYFSNRATVRKFSDRKIPEKLISDIVARAMRAPTCGNMQLYTVIATRGAELKRDLAALHFNQPAATGCDVILTVCADFNRFTRWCELSNAKPGYDNLHSFIVALTDAVIFAQQIVTVAETEGLGTCYLGTVNYTAAQTADLLELPRLVVPVVSIALGYPAETGTPTERLPVEAVLHMEKYRNDSDSELLALHKEKEDYPANREFAAQNGKETLAQVFTDIRYPEKTNLEVSKTFADLLVRQGFLK